MNLEEICLPIKSELQEVERCIQERLTSKVPLVSDVAEYVIRDSGKRLRPVLCLFASRLSGVPREKAVEAAASLEFFHTATLMHDDVIDDAEIRRGKASVKSRWGNHISVLVGDFFYCRASDLLVRGGNLRAIELMTRAMIETTEGEILETAKSNDMSITEEEYLTIIMKKTAVLLSASCEMGGVLGNVSEEFNAALRHFGNDLGIAFQLADDVLDYISELDKFGKPAGTDLKEGKLTLPLMVALRGADPAERRLIKDALIAEKLEDSKLKEILSLIERFNGIGYTLDLAKRYVASAKKSLDLFKPTLDRDALLAIADYVTERKN